MAARGGSQWTQGARLSALDASFLRLETPSAHMHVGWSAVFAPPVTGERPTLQALRQRVASRLDDVGWCRWKLVRSRFGLVEPNWRADPDFDLTAHVLGLSEPGEAVSYDSLAATRDGLLSEPMDLRRPPWQIFLIPRLEDDRVGIIGKIHHSLVDGVAALQIVSLIVDGANDRPTGGEVDLVSSRELSPVTVAGRAVGGARRAVGSAGRAVGGGAQVACAIRDEMLPRAPASILNVPIGPDRALVGYHAPRAALQAARAGGGTLNDIGLTVVAGALRTLSIGRGELPEAPLKAMVPVSMRRANQTGPGNRISMVYIRLPIDLALPTERLNAVRDQTQQLKRGRRPENMQALYAAGQLVPAPLRSPVTRAMASPRVFNLTISQSPGPQGTVYVLGCELQDVYSVVPIADRHALGVGMVRYRRELFIGCYADPVALPEVAELPSLLEEELHALASRTRPATSRREPQPTSSHSN